MLKIIGIAAIFIARAIAGTLCIDAMADTQQDINIYFTRQFNGILAEDWECSDLTPVALKVKQETCINVSFETGISLCAIYIDKVNGLGVVIGSTVICQHGNYFESWNLYEYQDIQSDVVQTELSCYGSPSGEKYNYSGSSCGSQNIEYDSLNQVTNYDIWSSFCGIYI